MTIDDEVERLYKLPLSEFTADRNALAKRVGGPDAARIKKLEKPSVPAWAVNQLFWKHRRLYDQLIEAADKLRSTHRALVSGKAVDLQKAEGAHRERARAAVHQIRQILSDSDEAATDVTMTAVAETLDALPAIDARPGRLTKPLRRMGFEALAGVTPAPAGARDRKLSLVSNPAPSTPPPPPKPSVARRREIEAAEIRLRTAQAEERQAEKDLELARRSVQRTEQALEQATDRRKKREQDLERIKEA